MNPRLYELVYFQVYFWVYLSVYFRVQQTNRIGAQGSCKAVSSSLVPSACNYCLTNQMLEQKFLLGPFSSRAGRDWLLSYGLFQSAYIPVICEITDAKHESLPLPVTIVES